MKTSIIASALWVCMFLFLAPSLKADPVLAVVTKTDVSCNGLADGSITISIVGVPPFS